VNGVFAQVSLVAAVLAISPFASAQSELFSPPRLLRAELPAEPPSTVLGGGEVLIEFIVDQRGGVTHPQVIRSTTPYTQMVLAAIMRWRFEPARMGRGDTSRVIAAPVTVSAIYRPPTLLNGPAPGDPPNDLASPSADVAYPVAMVSPAYPPRALDGSVLLFEVALDSEGRLTDARGIVTDPAFESAARSALAAMRFRGATSGAHPVPSTTYVLFGFRPPVVSSMR